MPVSGHVNCGCAGSLSFIEEEWHCNFRSARYILQKYYGEEANDLYKIRTYRGGNKIRKHRGIHQTGGKAGKLKKGFKYSGKRFKNGKAEIVKCRS